MMSADRDIETWHEGMPNLWYVYPMHHVVSFTLVAKRHIEQLKKRFLVNEVCETAFLNIRPYSKPTVLIHPLIYAVGNRLESFVYFTSYCNKTVGFEVADSDALSDQAVSVANCVDALILPSKWAVDAYRRSGVVSNLHIVPHGVPNEFLRERREPENPFLRKLKEIKEKKKYMYILHFLWHSGYRKGVDLVKKAIEEVQKSRENVVLVLVNFWSVPSVTLDFGSEKTINITGFLEDSNKVDLYDICDIYYLFSRGGGFELNGLEAVCRGEIVIAPDKGPWTEYLPQEFLVPTARMVRVFPDNPYHIGLGPEIDVQKAVDKTLDIVDNIDIWRERALNYALKIRQQYTWDAIGEKLINIVSQYL